jgi:ATP-dependent Lon protease
VLFRSRNDLRIVVAPALNEPDAEDIPEHLRRKLRFIWVSEVGEVLDRALEQPA